MSEIGESPPNQREAMYELKLIQAELKEKLRQEFPSSAAAYAAMPEARRNSLFGFMDGSLVLSSGATLEILVARYSNAECLSKIQKLEEIIPQRIRGILLLPHEWIDFYFEAKEVYEVYGKHQRMGFSDFLYALYPDEDLISGFSQFNCAALAKCSRSIPLTELQEKLQQLMEKFEYENFQIPKVVKSDEPKTLARIATRADTGSQQASVPEDDSRSKGNDILYNETTELSFAEVDRVIKLVLEKYGSMSNTAKMLGVPRTTLQDIATGRKKPRWVTPAVENIYMAALEKLSTPKGEAVRTIETKERQALKQITPSSNLLELSLDHSSTELAIPLHVILHNIELLSTLLESNLRSLLGNLSSKDRAEVHAALKPVMHKLGRYLNALGYKDPLRVLQYSEQAIEINAQLFGDPAHKRN